ncbi:hypothetical protein SAMN06296036_119111 [Pseudobacteriovorax antillogorgiicola]|uniref:Uncharacterized protein n=1 Tax=Pseudobacteriovorax antillogorgiicola TaxID=1513793 RepID=A0A1Y6CJY2_9BACT|nr:hypothetical protein EDD56_119110 [Pseudobacteriovorax antillogorgiicola]SMF58509.1 hypothetical protein SAMN06296036_119111 [Pseudobacteriovorax antillogorgiicola]
MRKSLIKRRVILLFSMFNAAGSQLLPAKERALGGARSYS